MSTRIQEFKKFSKGTVIQPERVKLVVPSFTLAASDWAGASVILAEYPFGNDDYRFSIKTPTKQFGTNFIAAIRWVMDGFLVYRFKLWDDEDAVLLYPVYDGERIGLNATLEIWSINSADEPTLAVDHTFYSSVLVFPDADQGAGSCCCSCEQPEQTITLVASIPSPLPPSAYCNPFCASICS
jgi:hypothetical protein